jgi:PAS domain S-box-containing protein
MKDFQFQFDVTSFNKLFPFYILINADLNIKNCGISLIKLLPASIENKNFNDLFKIKRPFIQNLDINNIGELVSQLVTIAVAHKSEIILRGEFQKYNEYFLFVGSPWFVSMEDVISNKLKLNDFATHDPLIDLLHVLKAQELTNEDLKGLIFKITQQQKKLTADKEEIQKLSLVASANKSGVALTDLRGKIFWTNDAYLRMTGYAKSDVIDHTIVKLSICELSDRTVLKNMITAFTLGENFDNEIYHKKKDNGSFWSRMKGQPVLNSEGKIIQYFVIIDDITKEKEVHEKLKESESRLNSLILNLHAGILLEDENRKILLVNKEFCTMFGLDINPDQMIGMDCTNSAEESKYFFQNHDQFVTRIDEILQRKEIVKGEELRLIDGRVFERSYIPITIDGKYKGHLWSYDDITLLKNYNEGLKHEKEKYRSIIDNMNIGLVEVDLDDTILTVNNRFSEMSGYDADYLIGMNTTNLFLDNENKEILTAKNKDRNLGIADSYELTIKNNKGEHKQWLISGAPNYNINGEVVGSIGMHLDITDIKNLEIQKEKLLKKLEKQNQQLNEYAHVVSHDLKSPLRSIHSLITFIKEDNDTEFNAKTAKYFTLIQEKVEKMDRLIQGILTYSKIATVELLKEKIDVNELIQHIITILYIPSHVKIITDFSLPVIVADRFKIQQLFQNLISNAINYSDKPNAEIKLSFEEYTKYYVFSIEDNGIGIPKKNQNKIFEMFTSFNTDEVFSGIGLAIVKRIIENLNEKIWFESEPSIGSKFFFTIHK